VEFNVIFHGCADRLYLVRISRACSRDCTHVDMEWSKIASELLLFFRAN
jgi:hypothetical protein